MTDVLPIDSHPVTYQQIGNDLWTQKPYHLILLDALPDLSVGHLVSNMLSAPDTEVLTIGCDGSVYVDKEVAACTWIIAEDSTHSVLACFLLKDIS